jgi:NADPH:quinone reductase-like Zn-dependent oxidoreductase
MRAVRFNEFGSPDVLKIEELDKPTAGSGEVVVRVLACGVGAGEADIRAGRMRRIMRLRPPSGVSNEYFGEVDSVGDGVTRLAVGDRVWGVMPHLTFGSAAEFVAVPDKLVGSAPEGLDAIDAAALPVSGTTLLEAFKRAVLKAGDRILIRGAAGGLGSLAVQIAKADGAHVTALAGAASLDWIRDDLGAHVALDYRTVDPTTLGPFDVVLDTYGRDTATYRRTLTPKGRYLALAVDPNHMLSSMRFVILGSLSPRRKVVSFSNSSAADDLDALKQRVEAGQVRPVVDTVYELEQVVEAHRRLESGGIRGKLVIDLRATPRNT